MMTPGELWSRSVRQMQQEPHDPEGSYGEYPGSSMEPQPYAGEPHPPTPFEVPLEDPSYAAMEQPQASIPTAGPPSPSAPWGAQPESGSADPVESTPEPGSGDLPESTEPLAPVSLSEPWPGPGAPAEPGFEYESAARSETARPPGPVPARETDPDPEGIRAENQADHAEAVAPRGETADPGRPGSPAGLPPEPSVANSPEASPDSGDPGPTELVTREADKHLPVPDYRKGYVSVADEHPDVYHSSPLIPSRSAPRKNTLERDPGIWLCGSGTDLLENCTKAEQRKHGALGLTVLVPATFALIASSYAVSTLTNNLFIIVPIAIVWAAIILLIDRSILATYRSSLAPRWKAFQFGIRMTVATLMGLTISHPITLLLFKDTITAQIEQERDEEIAAVRQVAAKEKAAVESKIAAITDQIEENREEYRSSFQASFLEDNGEGDASLAMPGELTPADRDQMRAKIEGETADLEERLAELDAEKQELLEQQQTLTEEIAHWQSEYEAEVNGERSGRPGVGPRARSIENDQLAWRRQEADRITTELTRINTNRFDIEGEMQRIANQVQAEFVAMATERAERQRAEQERVADLKRRAQETQLTSFVEGQDGVRSQIQAQIDSGLADLQRLRGEVTSISEGEQERIAEIEHAPRRDLLTQTLALHHLFVSGSEGGRFALVAYLVLAGLFLAVDTIPIIVKFTSKGGEYDEKLDQSHYEAALAMVASRKSHMELLHQETLQKLEGTQEIFEQESALLRTRLELIDRQIEVARKETQYRNQFGFAQRLPRAS